MYCSHCSQRPQFLHDDLHLCVLEFIVICHISLKRTYSVIHHRCHLIHYLIVDMLDYSVKTVVYHCVCSGILFILIQLMVKGTSCRSKSHMVYYSSCTSTGCCHSSCIEVICSNCYTHIQVEVSMYIHSPWHKVLPLKVYYFICFCGDSSADLCDQSALYHHISLKRFFICYYRCIF